MAVKYFKARISIIIGAAMFAFVLNVLCLCSLYNSIADDVKREVFAAMVDMNIDELWQRAVSYSGIGDLQQVNGSLDSGNDTIVVKEIDCQGNERVVNRRRLTCSEPFTNQLVSEMSNQMHRQMDGMLPMNISDVDSILRLRLAERGIRPDFIAVEVVDTSGNVVVENKALDLTDVSGLDVFQMPYGSEKHFGYRAYVTPLIRHILYEMSGVIATTFILILIFAVGFGYMIYTVSRLRALEEMKDDFTRNMTHELKTPIAIAYSANDALLNFDYSNNRGKKDAYLKISMKQLKRLAELVEGILAMSMERRKTMSLYPERIRLISFVEEIVLPHRMRCDKAVTIDVVAKDLDVVVEADKTHLANVLNNLIDNAVKYSGESVDIKIICDNSGISIADDGIGIPSKCIPYLFDKFYRVPQGNRLDVRGYGIGLYYVKNILAMMGWSISVRSKLGNGSVFTIKFRADG